MIEVIHEASGDVLLITLEKVSRAVCQAELGFVDDRRYFKIKKSVPFPKKDRPPEELA
jgi:hypothetical protein